MFYGSGAGKLPTASAVVADIVDAAKHLSKNIWTIWSSKKLELTDINQVKHRFFIRVQANDLAVKEHISKLFQDVEEITTEGVTGEYAFLTQNISEQELKEKQNKLDGILSVIRVRF
jgi:homoserine dehydrogenase